MARPLLVLPLMVMPRAPLVLPAENLGLPVPLKETRGLQVLSAHPAVARLLPVLLARLVAEDPLLVLLAHPVTGLLLLVLPAHPGVDRSPLELLH